MRVDASIRRAGLLELLGPALGHAAHAFRRRDAADRALARRVIGAVGVAVLHPETLGGAQLFALRSRPRLQELLIGVVEPLVPDLGLAGEAVDDLVGVAVAFRRV